MNIGEKYKNPSPSEDLTVVFLRGNGSPRSFRLSLPALYRSLTAIGFVFALSLLAAIVLLGLSLMRGRSNPSMPVPTPAQPPVAVAPPTAPLGPSPGTAPAAGSAADTGLWGKLQGAVGPSDSGGKEDSELQKEVTGLRQDLAKLNAQIDQRKDLPSTSGSPLMQFFGPRSTLVPDAQSMMKIRNAKAVRDTASKQILLDFELHNVDPQQRQERGYIVALAKAPDLLISYPSAVFAPTQNIVLDFSKGETFAVSRFRQARATFPLSLLENRKTNYQILLFGTDGKVLGNVHVEEAR